MSFSISEFDLAERYFNDVDSYNGVERVDDETLKVVNVGAPAFARNSVAYLDGVEVASGEPRHPYGVNMLPYSHSIASNAFNVQNFSGSSVTQTLLDESQKFGSSRIREFNSIASPSDGNIGYPRLQPGGNVTGLRPGIYRATCWIRVLDNPMFIVVGVVRGSSYVPTHQMPNLSPEQGWVQFDATREFFESHTSGSVGITPRQSTGRFQVAQLQLELLEDAEDPGFPWRPGGPSAILIEEGTENVILSQADSFGDWSDLIGGETFTKTSNVSDPFGGSNAYRFECNGDGTSTSKMHGGWSGITDDWRTMSIYIRPLTEMALDAVGLSEGTSTGRKIYEGDELNRWHRYSHAGVGDDVTNTRLRARVAPGDPVDTQIAFELAYGQTEDKPYATSWHPRGAMREADNFFTADNIFTLPDGTLEIDLRVTEPEATFGRTLFQIMKASGFAFQIYNSGGDWRFNFRQDDGTNAILVTPVPVEAGLFRLSVTWNDSAYRVRMNGSASGFGTRSFIPPTTLTQGRILNFNSHILGIRVSNKERSDAELADWRKPLEADEHTTYLMNFEDTLRHGAGGTYTSPMFDLGRAANGSEKRLRFNLTGDADHKVVKVEFQYEGSSGWHVWNPNNPKVFPGYAGEQNMRFRIHLATSDVLECTLEDFLFLMYNARRAGNRGSTFRELVLQ